MGTILIEVPEECKGLADGIREFVAKVVSGRKQGFAGGRSVDYGALEVGLGQAAAKVESEGHRAILGSFDVDVPAVMIDGVRHSRAGRSMGTYYTLAGAVQVERTLYRTRGDKCVDAIGVRTGMVGNGWLPQTARAMAQQVARMPSREAESSAQEVGRLVYSRSSFERVAHLVGEHYLARHQDIEDVLIEEFEVPEEARSVSISLDRVSVPMEEPKPKPRGRPRKDAPKRPVVRVFRMAYCGTVTLHDGDGKALHTIRYGSMAGEDPNILCASLGADAAALLNQRPELKVAAVCDGAPEMWNLLAPYVNETTLGTPVTRLVDFHHLIEKLGVAARVIHGSAASPVVDRWRLGLLNSSTAADRILAELKASGREHICVGTETPVHAAITYFENHRGMFDYRSARAAGLPIGSGNVEATCKSLFEVRFKRCGARWKEESGEHIVHLRALVLSDRWPEAITRTLQPLRKSVRVAA